MSEIEQLIIIAAPSCAGKSYLIKKIQQNDCPLLCKQLGIAIPSSWDVVEIQRLKRITQPVMERLIIHYDLYSQYSQNHGFKHLDELIRQSGKVVVLTLKVSQDLLIQRADTRLRSLLPDLIAGKGPIPRIKILRKIIRLWGKKRSYRRGFSDRIYTDWLNQLHRSNITNRWLMNLDGPDITRALPDIIN